MHDPDNPTRSREQIREHYEVECELATRLRCASKAERRELYGALYDELYRRVPLHPQLTRKRLPEAGLEATRRQLEFLRRFLRPDGTYLEIGAGDCRLAFAVAGLVRKAYGLDVSAEITRRHDAPANFELVLSDGCSIPVPAGSIDVAYSNQVMEHLHPDDALEQLGNIHRALADGGRYVCITPNRLNGPHDVSRYFDTEPRGLHLREYTTGELVHLFRATGFRSVDAYVWAFGRYVPVPGVIPRLCERLLQVLPAHVRRVLGRRGPVRRLLGIQVVGIK